MSNKNSFQEEERSFVADQQTEVRISGFDKKGSLLISFLKELNCRIFIWGKKLDGCYGWHCLGPGKVSLIF